ncbi:N-acetyltransferase family protein [Sutcliffiella cohnii]
MSSVNIRKATLEDAEGILKHSKVVFGEGRNLLTTVEEFTLTIEEEEQWMEKQKRANNLVLVAEVHNEIVGMLNATRSTRKRVQHLCQFGISIQEAYCNKGIGSQLITKLIEWAKQDEVIEKICLEVFASNERAIYVYEKYGFVIEGMKKKHIKFEDGAYADEYNMGLFVK